MINLRQLEIEAGNIEGARQLFQELIAHLVKIKHKSAKSIRPAPGDWGIDVLVGRLVSGTCMIWQAKYFMSGIGKTQKGEIRKSFKQVIKKSQEHRFKIDVWTLSVPCSLSPEENRWWENWQKRSMKETGVKIDLMHELDIKDMLMTSEAENVRLGFFGNVPSMLKYHLQSIKGADERDIQRLPNKKLYKNSMFIKKLTIAGIRETLSAKTQFFNAELLKSEIHDKGDQNELNELDALYEKIRSMWETRFNKALNSENPERDVPSVYPEILQAIEERDKSALNSPRIMASFVHKQGFVQQLADLCEIGWTPGFRNLDKGGDRLGIN
jgi:hypothetical protein